MTPLIVSVLMHSVIALGPASPSSLLPLVRSTPMMVLGETPEDETCLLLRNGRFRVEASFYDDESQPMKPARAVSLREETGFDETGYFSFGDPEKIDLIVRLFDGCDFNEYFWVFYGSLSKLGYELTVTDTQTGVIKEYSNPLGQMAPPIQDTEAFATCPSPKTGATLTAKEKTLVGLKSGETMSLQGGRFEIEVDYTIPGESGRGTVGVLTENSGAWWLRDRSDFNIYLQIMDGRPINGHYWLTYTSFTGANYEMRVTDTLTNLVRTYTNPLEESTYGRDIFLTAPGDTRLIYPWISNSSRFNSRLIVNNQNCIDALVTLEARRAEGEAEIIERLIPAGGFLEEAASDLFPDHGLGPGYAVYLYSNVAGILGNWITQNLDTASGASPSQGVAIRIPPTITQPLPPNAQVGNAVLFGYMPLEDGFFSAAVLTNVGDEPTDIDLYIYDLRGKLLRKIGQAMAGLSPNRPATFLPGGVLPGRTDPISIVARSEGQPLTGVSFVFNGLGEPALGNASAIDFVPPLGCPD